MSSPDPSILSIFADALTFASREERSAYLDRTCAGNPALREEVELLLEAHDDAQGFLETTDASAAQHEFRPGMTIDARYKLLESIGEGGMGTVWVAEQLAPVRRKVAIKLVKPGMDSRQVLARFEAERQALALMDHPNIAKVYDGGVTEQGRPYFVMEYVKGIPLTKYCDDARLSLQDRLKLYVQVCQAVQHAHQKGIIHRDLKPSNILVCLYDGRPVPKVIDFGLAKAMHQPLTEHTLHTAHGFMVGTPLYMSPEQAEFNNLDVDTRTDIYSLGVILYELLTGSTPLEQQQFKKAALDEMLRLIKEVEPPKPSTRLSGSASLPSIAAQRGLDPVQLSRAIKGDLDWIVMKTLEKERSRRYETANGLARDVERFLNDEAVEACPPSAGYRMKKLLRRHRGTAITATAILVMLILAVVGTSAGFLKARRALSYARISEQKAVAAAKAEAKARVAESIARQNAERSAQQALEASHFERLAKEDMEAVLKFFEERVVSLAKPEGLGGLGRETTVRKALELSLPYVKSSFQNKPLTEARLSTSIGRLFLAIDEPSLAEPLFQHAQDLLRKHAGDKHRLTLAQLGDQAYWLGYRGRWQEATALWRERYESCRREFGEDDPQTLEAMRDLVHSDYFIDNHSDATILAEELLVRSRAKLGKVHAGTRTSMVTLARALGYSGDSERSVQLLRECREICQSELGAEDPETISVTIQLASALLNANVAGKKLSHLETPAEALRMMENAIDLQVREIGSSHLDAASNLAYLANWYAKFGRNEEACRAADRAVEGLSHSLGEEHYSTLVHRTFQANAYRLAGKPDRSVKILDQSLPIMAKKKGASDKVTLMMMEELAQALRGSGEYERANRLSLEVLDKALETLDADSNQWNVLQERAKMLTRRGKMDEAIGSFEASLALAPEELSTAYGLAHVLAIRGDRVTYKEHCERMLRTFGSTTNPIAAERTAKACLLLADAGMDLAPIVALAERAIDGTDDHPYYRYFLFTRALAHYRSGEFEQAIQRLQQSMTGDGVAGWSSSAAYLLLSMSQWKQGQVVEARQTWSTAQQVIEFQKIPVLGAADLTETWVDALLVRLLEQEGKSLFAK